MDTPRAVDRCLRPCNGPQDEGGTTETHCLYFQQLRNLYAQCASSLAGLCLVIVSIVFLSIPLAIRAGITQLIMRQ
jgi:hypothetical protein